MASVIILALYIIIILMYLIISFFVVYHISTYATVSELKIIMLVFFVIVATGLLVFNMSLFFSIDWKNLTDRIFI